MTNASAHNKLKIFPDMLALISRPTKSDGFGITCGNCQHNADIDKFSAAPIFGELPKGEYQCPACMAAIKQLPGQIISIESRL